jgi:hypothetical protein
MTQRHVAQRRHLEGTAKVGAGRHVRARAQAQIEERGIVVLRQRRIARQAQVVVAEVGEQREAAIGRPGRRVTGLAVAFGQAVEQAQAAQFGVGQRDLAAQEFVVLAGERAEHRVFALVLLQRECQPRQGVVGPGEDVGAEKTFELVGIGDARKLVDDVGGRGRPRKSRRRARRRTRSGTRR